jgi:hypothetical protein
VTQGEIFKGELAMAATEEREDAQQVKQRGDHGTGLSPDQRGEINSLRAARGLAKDTVGSLRRHFWRVAKVCEVGGVEHGQDRGQLGDRSARGSRTLSDNAIALWRAFPRSPQALLLSPLFHRARSAPEIDLRDAGCGRALGCIRALGRRPNTPVVQVLGGAEWCIMVWLRVMAETERTVRQSVSIPAGIAKRVRTLAKTRKTSANRVLVDLIEAGLQSKEAEKERFFSLVSRLTESSDPAERERLKDELARMTFGG